MTELTKEQIKEMEAAWLPLALDYSLQPFKAGYTAAVNRECVWNEASAGLSCFYETPCGSTFDFIYPFCPNCGGKVVEGNG